MSLHSRITTALDLAEETARAFDVHGDMPEWTAVMDGERAIVVSDMEPQEYVVGCYDDRALAGVIALGGPAAIRRQVAHGRSILARHTPVTITYPITLTICSGCSLPNGRGGWGVGEAFYGLMPADRCRELPDLAEALGVNIEEASDRG